MSKRYAELDSLKGIAALSVVLGHLLAIKYKYFALMFNAGGAVDLFFVLSGFVLFIPYKNKEEKLEVIPYLVKRFFRIYPAYWTALLLAVILNRYFYDLNANSSLLWLSALWKYKFYTTNLLNSVTILNYEQIIEINRVFWSLFVEVQISFLFPIIILIVHEIESFKNWFIYTGLILGLGYFTNSNVVNYSPLFLIGALAAKHIFDLSSFLNSLSKSKKIFIFIIGILMYFIRINIPVGSYNLLWVRYVCGIGVTILIVFSLSVKKLSSLLHFKLFKFLGKISYSLYLIHLPILISFSSILYPIYKSESIIWIATIFATIITAFLINSLIEKPFIKLGKKIIQNNNTGQKSIISEVAEYK